MKRLLCYLLVLLFTFHSVGSSFMFLVLQWQIRREVKHRMKEALPETKLHVLSFSRAQADALDWKEPGREFRYAGMMYDVVRVQHQGGQIRYHCLTDAEEEEGLLEGLDHLVQEYLARSSKKKNLKRLAKSLTNVYQQISATLVLQFFQLDSSAEFKYLFSLSTSWQDIPVPPPKQA
ncbi:MAG: hypothetical protein ACO1OQ_15175 [Rufibacter sp.]